MYTLLGALYLHTHVRIFIYTWTYMSILIDEYPYNYQGAASSALKCPFLEERRRLTRVKKLSELTKARKPRKVQDSQHPSPGYRSNKGF